MNNIVFANFECNETNKIVSQKVWQWNYGQILRIQGLDLPDAVEIHFSLQESGGTAVRRIGVTKDGVTDVVIPDFILENEGIERDYTAYAFIYLSTEESGQTEHRIELNIKSRPEPEGSSGSDETSFGAIMDAVNKIATGKADGLEYKDSILKLMSGEVELARVTIAGGSGTGSGTDGREIELQNNGTYIQWHYAGETTWKNLIALSEISGDDGKDAYEYAKDGGYTGTEEEFAKKLAQENPTREEFSQLSDTIADKATLENNVIKFFKSGETDKELFSVDVSSIGGTGGLDLNNLVLSVSQVGEYQRLSMSDGTTTKTVDIPITAITDEQVQTAVETWLDEHPEATTTISDGSIAEKHLVSELQKRIDDIEYVNKGGKEYEIYPYSEEIIGDKDIGNFAIVNDVPIKKGGLLETVEFPTFTAQGNTQLYILEKIDDAFSVVSKYTVTITGNITDLSSLDINVLAGQYLAIVNTANFKANIQTDDSTAVRYVNASNSTNILSGVYGKTSVKFNILVADNGESITVKEKVLEQENIVGSFDARIEENKMLALESSEVYFYPNSEYVESDTEQATNEFICFQVEQVPTDGILRYVYLPRFTETFTATVGIVKESDGIYTLIRKHSVEINAKKTDLKEYEIEVNQGEYIALGLNMGCTVGKYAKTGSVVRYMTTDTIGSTLGGQYLNGFALDTNYIIQTGYYGEDVIVKEKVKEIDKRTKNLENNVYQLNNLDNFANVRILHIGTSISDGRTVHSGNYMCTWFKEAMQMLNCSNGVNMANSGKGATYHAENYDTDIAPYIVNTDIFTIEHYINDISSMGTKDDLEPDENGNYNITTYQGAMAYIITRARKENPFVKIGLMSHWFNENVATELQEIADKFKLPVLDVGKMLGGHSQQIVDTTMTIRGVEYTGARTISLWYTTSSMYPDGDNLHPFNDKAQTKYAYGYAGWLKSGLI